MSIDAKVVGISYPGTIARLTLEPRERVEPCLAADADRRLGRATIEEAFRDYWNEAAAARYAADVAAGRLTAQHARQLMRREIMVDFSS